MCKFVHCGVEEKLSLQMYFTGLSTARCRRGPEGLLEIINQALCQAFSPPRIMYSPPTPPWAKIAIIANHLGVMK